VLVLLALGCRSEPEEPERDFSQPSQPMTERLARGAKLLEEADEAYRAERFGEANALYKLASEAAEREADPEVQGAALAMVARCYAEEQAGVELGTPFLLRAGDLANRERPKARVRYLAARGALEAQGGKLEDARITLGELFAYGREHDLHAWSADGAHQLALLAEGQERLSWCAEGLAAAQASADPLWQARLAWLSGETHLGLDLLVEASDAFAAAATSFGQVGHDEAAARATWARGHCLRRTGEQAAAREPLEQALTYARAEWERFHEPADARLAGRALWDLGELDAASGAKDSALTRLGEARTMLEESGFHRDEPEAFAALQARIAELQS
jgi:hypothetical protein